MFDAIVLAGGSGRRLGGIDKGSIEVGGRTLLARVLDAVAGAERIVVVGPRCDLPAGVLRTSERPAGGGPVAGLAAGLELVEAPLVAVLACDLPFVTRGTVRRLAEALGTGPGSRCDGAQLVDEAGRHQPLTAVYRTERLRAALSTLDQLMDTPMRGVLERLMMLDIEADPEQTWDCDTWADVTLARDRVDRDLLEDE
ncbi:MAG: hypothetical protein QOI51_2405 [Nocardioidaceae bacterium]|nr:hypothetical protein [Nocardioidaceae bacterium]